MGEVFVKEQGENLWDVFVCFFVGGWGWGLGMFYCCWEKRGLRV